jgi:hypothetical protein
MLFCKNGFLLEKNDVHILMYPDFPGVRDLEAGQDPEEGGFTRPVPCNECYLITFFNMEGNIFEKGLQAITLCQSFNRYIMHGPKIKEWQAGFLTED